MDWITLQENYFFMFLTLCSLCIGGFLVGILLGYVWIQLRQFGIAFTNQTHTSIFQDACAHCSATPDVR